MLLSLNYRDATLDASKIPEIFSKESMHPHRVQEKSAGVLTINWRDFCFSPAKNSIFVAYP